MEKKHGNTELIAFRVNKLLKAKLDAYCISRGQGLAAVIRCWIDNLPDVSPPPPVRERGGEGEGEEASDRERTNRAR